MLLPKFTRRIYKKEEKPSGFPDIRSLANNEPKNRRYPDGKTTKKEYQEKALW